MDDVKQLRLSLWENGYRPVAVRTQSKKPFGDNWLELAMQEPPYAITDRVHPLALSTGIVCQWLRAIDIDIDNKEMADEIEKVAFQIFGETIVRFRHDSPRRLFLYRTTELDIQKRILEFECGYKIEVLGPRQKFVAYGLHENGRNYRWRNRYLTQNDPPSPLTVPADQLMEISESQIDEFFKACAELYPIKKPIERSAPVISQSVGLIEEGRGRQYALSALEAVTNDLAFLGKGGRNNALNNASMRCGSFHARGWLKLDECQSALMYACNQNGLMKEDGIMDCMKTFVSGWSAGIERPAKDPIDRKTKQITLLPTSPIDYKIVEIEPEPIALDDSLTYPPGLLGDLTTWIAESGPTGNRRLALSAALALTSMLLGRNVSTPPTEHAKGSLELFIISTYPTGGGKKHQEDAINSIVDKLNLQRHMGSSRFKSDAFIEEMIKAKPLCLCIQDEFAQILNQITEKNAPSHVADITICLRKLFGMNFGVYRPAGALSREMKDTYAPSFSLYGMTVNHQLFKTIKGKDIANGIINRFMLIDGGDVRTTNDNPNKLDVDNPPPQLLQDLYRLYHIGAPTTGGLSGQWDKNILIKPNVYKVQWKDNEVRNTYIKFKKECTEMLDRDADIGEIYARTAFYAVKIATIAACCENQVDPRVSIEHMEWASKLAMESANRFYKEIKENMVDTLSYPELFKKIEQVLRWSPDKTIQRRKLWDKVKNYCGRSASDFSNCLKELEKNDVIECGKDGKMSVVRLI